MPNAAINSAQFTTTRRSALTTGAAIAGAAGTGLLAGPAVANGIAGGSHGAGAPSPWCSRCRPSACSRTRGVRPPQLHHGGYQTARR